MLRWAALLVTHAVSGAQMPSEIEPFVLAIIVALAASWLLALRLMLRIGERGQKFGVWLVTVLGLAAAFGFAAMIVTDLVVPPRTVVGTVQSLGSAYIVVVNGAAYGVRRADYEKLRIGARIRGEAGSAFNFLKRLDVLR